MSWNIEDNRNLFLKLKSKLGLYHVVLTIPKISSKKLTLTVVEMQQIPDTGKTDSTEKISCLKETIIKDRRKVYVHLKTDTENCSFVVYHYRSNLYL